MAAKNTSVFSRLGQEKSKPAATVKAAAQPSVTITGLGSINLPASASSQQSIFARLGGKTTVKRAATSTVTFDDDEDDDDTRADSTPLEYAGVLKESPTKKAKLEVAKKLTKTAHKTLAKAKIVQPVTAGVLGGGVGQSDVKSRLGPKVPEVSSTTQTKPSTSAKQGAVGRTSSSKLETITITVDTTSKAKNLQSPTKAVPSKAKGLQSSSSNSQGGVFSRLGKPNS